MDDTPIDVRFNNLMARVELETGVRPTQRDVSEATGLAESTLSRFAQGKTTRYDADLLVKLVDFFNERLNDGCSLADLLVYDPGRKGRV